LWAGFIALVNQQAAANGEPTAGFINPAIYALGQTTNYTACFHDITTGNNSWTNSPTNFPAVAGYDLCTGWGTPTGSNLINALAVFGNIQAPSGTTLYWDPGAQQAAPGSGGTGNWDAYEADWWLGGSSNLAWSTGAGNYAVFAGTAGTVTLQEGMDAGGLTFNTAGYTITGAALFLTGATPVISVPAGATTSINCLLGGSGYEVTGGGVLLLENVNNSSGSNNSPEYVIGPNTTLAVLIDNDIGNTDVTLNLENGGIYQDNDTTSGDQFLLSSCSIALGTGGGIINNPNASLTMANQITGSGSLTYTGVSSYTLTLTDTGDNYSGGTIVNGPGTLKANHAGTLGSTTGSLTVNGGILDLGGASQTVGAVTISGGTIQDGTLTGSSYSGSGGTVSAVLAGSAALTQTGSGTMTLSGANTYTGITTISGGLLQVGADNNLGAVPGSTVANKITLNNGGISSGLRCIGNFTLNTKRGITLVGPNGGSIQAATGVTLTYAGIITGSGNFGVGSSYNLAFGTTHLSGANNYTGTTTIAAGTLQLGANGTLPSGTQLIIGADGNTGGGAILDLNTHNQTIGPLASSMGIGGTGTDTPTIKLSGALTILQTNVNTVFSGAIIGSGGSLTLNGTSTLTLSGTNTYTGNTTLSAGTLALGTTGSISNSATISIAAGATFDVSAIASYALSSSTTLSASGTSTATTIKGGTTVNLGSRPITLAYDGSHPALTISQGALSLNGNTFTVNGAVLGLGTYTLIQQASGSVGSSGTYTVTGTAIGAGKTGSISVSGGNVNLMVEVTPAFSSLTSPSITYGTGSVTLTGVVSATGPVYPAIGDTVSVTINGHTVNGTVNNGTGNFSITYNDASLAIDGVGGSPYTITYAYGGNNAQYLTAATNNTSTALTVTKAALSITADAQSKTYGQTVVFGGGSALFTSSTLSNSETVGSVTLAVNNNGGAAAAAVSGSPYTITPSTATGGTFTAGNYNISYNTNPLTVNPATLTVTANNFSQPYGAVNPAFTVAYTNFVNGQTLGTSDVAGSPALSTSATTNSPVGAYDITNSLGTLTSTNYSFNLADGTLTLTNAVSSNVVSSSENPALPGDSVTITATLSTAAPSLAVPCGPVQFQIDGSLFGSPVPLTNGVASISTSSLSHGYHTNEADYAGDTNILGSTNTMIQLINTPPVAGMAAYSRPQNLSLDIAISNLLTNATDADGDALSLVAVSATSANGAAISTNATDLFYNPLATNGNVTDSFSYTVADIYGAASTNLVIVTIQPPPIITDITLFGDGNVQLNFTGTPGGIYLIEATTNLTPPITWTILHTNTADTNGVFCFIDHCATNYTGRYYQAAQ
jgi:autotransporter-associated beta strand protein